MEGSQLWYEFQVPIREVCTSFVVLEGDICNCGVIAELRIRAEVWSTIICGKLVPVGNIYFPGISASRRISTCEHDWGRLSEWLAQKTFDGIPNNSEFLIGTEIPPAPWRIDLLILYGLKTYQSVEYMYVQYANTPLCGMRRVCRNLGVRIPLLYEMA